MNCRPGDLAIFVESCAGNEGKIVHCLQYVGMIKWRGLQDPLPSWKVGPSVMAQDGSISDLVPDYQLRPINNPGDDAVDEVIQRIGTPHKEVA